MSPDQLSGIPEFSPGEEVKPILQRLRADHASQILAFELANRSYFAASISDRGDEYFNRFNQRHRDLLAEQESGIVANYVLVDEDGSVLGRFNLVDIRDGRAEVGYRVAERVAGQGVATTAVRELCRLAASDHGVRVLRARTTHQNLASRKVLTKVGFIPVGAADDVGGRPGTWYERNVAAESPDT